MQQIPSIQLNLIKLLLFKQYAAQKKYFRSSIFNICSKVPSGACCRVKFRPCTTHPPMVSQIVGDTGTSGYMR